MIPTRRRPRPPESPRASLAPLLAILGLLLVDPWPCGADQVVLNNGGLITGIVDRDNSIVTVYDGLKRTMVRHSKIDSINPEPPTARQQLERFSLVQPLEVHSGEMPSHALRIRTTPWDEFGQRMFEFSEYRGRSLRAERMKQAINDIGPDVVKFRGIDGFWLGQLATSQVPRDVILGLLDRVDPENKNERLRVARFLIQAKWYDESLAELERLNANFPELATTVANVRTSVRDLQLQQVLDDADRLVSVGQPRSAEALLVKTGTDGASVNVQDAIGRKLRDLRAETDGQRAFSSELRGLLDSSSDAFREALRAETFDLLQAIADAPDAVIPRLSPAREPLAADGSTLTPEARLSLALSSWILGAEHATDDPIAVRRLFDLRGRLLAYLATPNAAAPERDRLLSELGADPTADGESGAEPVDMQTISRLIPHLPPPLAGSGDSPATGVPLIRRVLDDLNPIPTEYSILLPPEYHPERSYPVVVILHDGRGTRAALDFWGGEAIRSGFIVLAPEYMTQAERPDYRYSPDEHAAVLLSLRDARKRFSIDPDRTFLAGSLLGGNAAWDVGLAHPDVFAGVVAISGLPAKHVARTKVHGELVPMLIVMGDLATSTADSIVLDMAKAMIVKTWDVTYVEYIKRGLEPLPEELPFAFDWMKRRTRTPHRKDFEVVSSRLGDDRFHGLVIRDYSPGRILGAEAVDPLGSNLEPATISCKTSVLSNLITLSMSGIAALDLWLTPEFIDFDERVQVRVNGKRIFLDRIEPDLRALLEDVRIRGDRTQLYWAKLPLGGKRPG